LIFDKSLVGETTSIAHMIYMLFSFMKHRVIVKHVVNYDMKELAYIYSIIGGKHVYHIL
jgi:hypothetical protein